MTWEGPLFMYAHLSQEKLLAAVDAAANATDMKGGAFYRTIFYQNLYSTPTAESTLPYPFRTGQDSPKSHPDCPRLL